MYLYYCVNPINCLECNIKVGIRWCVHYKTLSPPSPVNNKQMQMAQPESTTTEKKNVQELQTSLLQARVLSCNRHFTDMALLHKRAPLVQEECREVNPSQHLAQSQFQSQHKVSKALNSRRDSHHLSQYAQEAHTVHSKETYHIKKHPCSSKNIHRQTLACLVVHNPESHTHTQSDTHRVGVEFSVNHIRGCYHFCELSRYSVPHIMASTSSSVPSTESRQCAWNCERNAVAHRCRRVRCSHMKSCKKW